MKRLGTFPVQTCYILTELAVNVKLHLGIQVERSELNPHLPAIFTFVSRGDKKRDV